MAAQDLAVRSGVPAGTLSIEKLGAFLHTISGRCPVSAQACATARSGRRASTVERSGIKSLLVV